MKMSKLLAASLTLLSAVAVCTTSVEARNPAKGGGGSGTITLGVPAVFPAECGVDPLTQASFLTTTGFPLDVTVNEVTTETSGYAGALVFTPVENLVITEPSTFTSELPQGTFQHDVYLNPSLYSSQNPALEQAILYSWLNGNNNIRFGISFIPASQMQNVFQVSNQFIKGKSANITVTSNTNLTTLFNNGQLFNLIGNDPGQNAHNFRLLGIGTALVNLGASGTTAKAQFNSFNINGSFLAKAPNSFNINCAPLIPTNQAAAAAARAR